MPQVRQCGGGSRHCGGIGVIRAAAVKLLGHFTRSRLLVPNAYPLPEVPGEQFIFAREFPDLPRMMVGREPEISDLGRAVQTIA
jgi:hypothetical protein